MSLPVINKVIQAGIIVREQEERLDLLRHRLDGWCVWPLFRMRAAYALYDPTTPLSGNWTQPFNRQELLRLALRDLWRLAFTRKKSRTVILTSSSYRTEKSEGIPKDSLYDEYATQLENVIKVERINNKALFELNPQSVFP